MNMAIDDNIARCSTRPISTLLLLTSKTNFNGLTLQRGQVGQTGNTPINKAVNENDPTYLFPASHSPRG